MELSHSLEDYLEAIWILSLEKKVVRVKDIMNFLGYKVSSVNNALKNLAAKNLIFHEKYGYIELTYKGAKLAENIYKKHKTIKKFFNEILNIDAATSEKDACNVEHYLSDKTFNRFYHFIEFIEKEEPECLEKWKNFLIKKEKEEKLMKLSQLSKGKKGIIEKIDSNLSMKQKFVSMGIIPGETIFIKKVAPLGSPIDFIVKDYHLSLRKEEADMIIVKEVD